MKRKLSGIELVCAAEITDNICHEQSTPREQIETFGEVIDIIAENISEK